MKFHPDVLAAHAQFGGDLECMQMCYEYPDLKAEIERLRAALDASQDMHLSALRRLCIGRDTIRKMQERYENWTPIDVQPSTHSNPHALLEFRCISEADEDAENPEYFATRIWDERPEDAVEWCAINSPCFIAHQHQSQDTSTATGASAIRNMGGEG